MAPERSPRPPLALSVNVQATPRRPYRPYETFPPSILLPILPIMTNMTATLPAQPLQSPALPVLNYESAASARTARSWLAVAVACAAMASMVAFAVLGTAHWPQMGLELVQTMMLLVSLRLIFKDYRINHRRRTGAASVALCLTLVAFCMLALETQIGFKCLCRWQAVSADL